MRELLLRLAASARQSSFLAASLFASVLLTSPNAQAQNAPLSANDVSILFPAPKTQADLAGLISMADLSAAIPNGRLWSEADFARFLLLTDSKSQVEGTSHKIHLPPDAMQIGGWFVAGIRIDPGAPGLSAEIIEQFGRQPQLRFIVQPVTRNPNGTVTVHDVAGHLIFSFSTPSPDAPAAANCFPRPKEDLPAFLSLLRDFVALRNRLEAGQFGGVKVQTGGALNVHPGLVGPSAPTFRNAIKLALEKNLLPQRLTSMAIMGLDGPEPWIFLAMQKNFQISPPEFGAVRGPALNGQNAQMLSFRESIPFVSPEPSTNNQNKITCRNAAVPVPFPASERKGVATAELFLPGVTEARVKEVTDHIADAAKSHFFNTDCVSCHTDTRRAMAVAEVKSIAGIADAVLPKEDWNVRNFGWFTSFKKNRQRPTPPEPTVTRRTVTETAEVVSFINRELLNK